MHSYALLGAEVIDDVWKWHCQDPIKQAFRTHVVLRIANVEYDYEAKHRDHLIAQLIDVSQPGLPPCPVFGTKAEHDNYAIAVGLASGNNWPTHMTQSCEERYLQNLKTILVPLEVEDHTVKMATDVNYWDKYMRTHDYILELYMREIDALERAKGHIIGSTEAAIQIGAFRRAFNQHGGMPPYRRSTPYYLGRKRSLRTGIPNPYADVFYAGNTERTFASAITTERSSKLPKLYHWAPPLKTVFYTNPLGGPPDWVAVPEGAEPTSTIASSRVRGVTDLAIPEGCLTDNVSEVLNGDPDLGETPAGATEVTQTLATVEPAEPVEDQHVADPGSALIDCA